MEIFANMMQPLAKFARANMGDISMIIVATILMIYGSDINNFVRNLVAKFHFVVRIATFMALFAFGYGAITAYLVPQFAKMLSTLPNIWLPIVLFSIFLLLGILVEKKKP